MRGSRNRAGVAESIWGVPFLGVHLSCSTCMTGGMRQSDSQPPGVLWSVQFEGAPAIRTGEGGEGGGRGAGGGRAGRLFVGYESGEAAVRRLDLIYFVSCFFAFRISK